MIRATMAFRNTIRQPRRTLLLGGAIGLGVIIICLASGFTSGMEAAVQDNVTLLSGGHILVNGMTQSESGRSQNRIVDPSFEAKVRSLLPEAVSISRTAQSQATVVFGSREQQLRVRGVDWNADRLFSRNLILTEGSWEKARADRTIILGAQSARRFGLGLGDSVFVKLSTVTGQQNVTEYALGAVYDDAAAGGMTTAFVSLPNLIADLNMKEGQYQSLAIFLDDASLTENKARSLSAGLKAEGVTVLGAQAAARAPGTVAAQRAAAATASGTIAARRSAAAAAAAARPDGGTTTAADSGGAVVDSTPGFMTGPGAGFATSGFGMGEGNFGGRFFGNQAAGTTSYRLTTITEMSGQIGAVLGSVKWIGITIFAIMLVLTSAGIANTYRMVLMERTREIGMLRCIGFKRKDVFGIFVWEAGLMAVAGSLAGILVSIPLGLLIQLLRFNPSGSLGVALSQGHLLFEPSLPSFFLVSLAVLFSSILAVAGPARRASRLQPVEALRATA